MIVIMKDKRKKPKKSLTPQRLVQLAAKADGLCEQCLKRPISPNSKYACEPCLVRTRHAQRLRQGYKPNAMLEKFGRGFYKSIDLKSGSIPELAAKYNVSMSSISRWRRLAGVRVNRKLKH